ncbi:WD40 repeat-containing protein HOS15-like isoform X2 [Asparagus officinalis]|uniref:WD40 repeat-containing protein HOS15-like isoform X2 n=1 Tax=Asparagus officinalis TaxID=4686 RepID=UPI00098E648E|nr:WD40 repeat-containing protein HOS15-like isoform X2 [Asparagus officinalis]
MEETTPSVLTSDELNLLIFRYFQESGHLVTLVQKGLQYKEMQANLDSAKNSCVDFSLLQPSDIITKDVDGLQRIIKHSEKVCADGKDRGRLESDKEQDSGEDKVEEDKELVREHKKDKKSVQGKDKANAEAPKGKMKMKTKQHGVCAGKPMDITPNAQSVPCEIPSSDVVIVEGHSSSVSCCAWSPTNSLLASGSDDSTAQIWTIPDGPCGSSRQNLALCPKVLTCFEGSPETTKDVTALAWNGAGSLLATGYYDGQTRIWSKDGELKSILIKHEGLIFSLKWNKRGSHLLTGSSDKSAILWDTRTWECKQHYHCHHAPTLDVDWRNNNSFATCSVDCKICVFKIGNYLPCKVFEGHQDSVNCIKWDSNGSFLASCSDDKTAKIWSLKQDKCLHDFREHQGAVSTIRWSPTGPGTNNPSQQLLLASASSDSFVKLWDAELGRLVCNLKGHREEPVCSVEFSPNGQFLASGSSSDKCVNIWSVKEGQLVNTYRGGGEILQVCWNKEGNKIAACSSNGTVCVMDCRM